MLTLIDNSDISCNITNKNYQGKLPWLYVIYFLGKQLVL